MHVTAGHVTADNVTALHVIADHVTAVPKTATHVTAVPATAVNALLEYAAAHMVAHHSWASHASSSVDARYDKHGQTAAPKCRCTLLICNQTHGKLLLTC